MEDDFPLRDFLRGAVVVGLLLAVAARLIWAKVRKPDAPENVDHVHVPYGKTIVVAIIILRRSMFCLAS